MVRPGDAGMLPEAEAAVANADFVDRGVVQHLGRTALQVQRPAVGVNHRVRRFRPAARETIVDWEVRERLVDAERQPVLRRELIVEPRERLLLGPRTLLIDVERGIWRLIREGRRLALVLV